MPPTSRDVARREADRRLAEGEGHRELLSPSLSEASTMSTVTVGFGVDRDRVGARAAGVAGRVGVLPAVTVTEPVPSKPSSAVKVAV